MNDINLQPSILKRSRRAFTLIEILVVIGIIVILLSIVIPVVSKVRKSAQVAGVQAQINGLTGAIQRYQQDHGAYPGPIDNNDVYRTGFNNVNNVASPPDGYVFNIAGESEQITGSENLVLGLLGGLTLNTAGQVVYNPSLVGSGADNLNAGQQKRFAPYLEAINLSWRVENDLKTGHFRDEAGEAMDSIIPEFVDTFPDPLPILYLRAKKGTPQATGTLSDTNNSVITNVPRPAGGLRRGHYDISQYFGYVQADADGNYIGVGKDVSVGDYTTKPLAGKLPHGLLTVDPNASLDKSDPNYEYPYNAFPYFKNPSSSSTNPQPRSKDGYILISAGVDRVYGTADDITSFGSVTE